jgi:hypothetical protein
MVLARRGGPQTNWGRREDRDAARVAHQVTVWFVGARGAGLVDGVRLTSAGRAQRGRQRQASMCRSSAERWGGRWEGGWALRSR